MADGGAGGSPHGASSNPSGKTWRTGVHEQEACKSAQLTFTLTGEDHTLGNAIRSILVRKPGVEFAGYSVPHPTQPEMNIRLQTTGESAMQLLRESFDDLANICDHLDTLYDEALEEFSRKQGESSERAS
ncbi:DNA-directed RNA polymerase I 16 kDa polypeptide,related [Neospora caninum Liverpool]|uniref:DNA-directed RNA polymerase I 16 kDa polypeptide,related n=1 Tax=Neospora caninum (strain Liverpool) TaxID=572307 RepID=F0VGG1_NEOCL|nr:DNA-directed RNA polymerase I 16 kDa polypeptide,related [Neospora caninum Liverpool]CBZ52805.1 DNA-directed RNA polymerase I 16 kDa polypeptide,related [Neospora caninum Liverpool]CEL66787.1 TPA: DNA-directed RNA polymerase I 16 kDa polypeptide,related [Neospora caninum Liverpool]|eukprot:XP_003882837.1 DNA-directed RNA polymerase I 16 kDa polypeptide,related [Neospora caninum Liverpool]